MEIITGIVIPIICLVLVPVAGWLAIKVIKMGEDLAEVRSDLRHLKGNYAQSMEGIADEMREMRADIKELLRRSYKEEGKKEANGSGI